MDRAQGAATRLRRTFRYPADEDDDSNDSQPEAIDEEEQERLIADLARQNASRDASFRTYLVAVPLLAIIPYLPSLLLQGPSARLTALLSITSLLSTAFLLHQLPPSTTGIAPLDAWVQQQQQTGSDGQNITRGGVDATARLRRMRGQLRGDAVWFTPGESPLLQYLPYLNLGLVLVLVVMGWLGAGAGVSFGVVSMTSLPGSIYVVVIVAKAIMGGVDPERDLSGLRYEYKGA